MDYLAHGRAGLAGSRASDQSAVVIDSDLGLYLIADGVGGRGRGTVAAKTAANLVHVGIASRRAAIRGSLLGNTGAEKAVPFVVDAIQDASRQMHEMAQKEAELAWMGATLTLVMTIGAQALIAHVGDCRVVLARDDELHQLTVDHTLAGQLLSHGVLSAEDLAQQALVHGVVRALGTHPSVVVDTLVFDVLYGDLFCLCSGGLSALGETTLAQVIRTHALAEIPDQLLKRAQSTLGETALSAIVVQASVDEETRPLELERSGHLQLKRALVSESPLFAGLSWRESAEVLAICATENVSAGERRLNENDANDTLLLVLWGELEVTCKGRLYRRIKAGEWFGVSSLVDDRPLQGSVHAEQNARIVTIPTRDLDVLFSKKSRIGSQVLRNLAQHYFRRVEQELMGWAAD